MKKQHDIETIKNLLKNSPYETYEAGPVNNGVSTEVYCLKKEGSPNLYLRILGKNESSDIQALAHELALKQKIKVPKVLYTQDKLKTIDNRSYMIVEEIPGKSLRETSDEISPKDRQKILYEAGKDISKLNRIKVEGVGLLKGVKNGTLYSEGQNYNDFFLNNMTQEIKELLELGVLDEKIVQKIKTTIKEKKHLLDIKGNSWLAHGDFCPDHIYQKNGVYTGIIDLGDVRGTSRYHDLAHIYFYDYKNENFEYVANGYFNDSPISSDQLDKIKFEALLIGISKLWWIVKYFHEAKSHIPRSVRKIDELLK